MTSWVLAHIIAAYLIGSLSSAIVLTRIFAKTDIRSQGSGNPGATNVLRVVGKKASALVLVFDICKGALPVYIGFLMDYSPLILSAIAISTCLGHMYPVFFQFKGGKAVATALGAMMPLNWLLAIALLGTWIAVFALVRVSSIAAISTLLAAPVYTYFLKAEYTIAVGILCILIIAKHKANIARLLQKKENRFQRK